MERGCRNCMWLYHMVTHNQTAPCSECLDYDKWQTAKSTNADRIRAMSDEELAVFFDYEYGRCEWCKPERFNEDCSDNCMACIIDWLKQEAKDGD